VRNDVSMALGIVVPCFNEEARWNSDYWRQILTASPARFLFVDDGSRDRTRGLLQETAASGNAAVLELPGNVGKAEAVRTGLTTLLTDSEVSGVGYLDADGAFGGSDVLRIQEIFQDRANQGQFDALWSSRVALAGRDIQRSSFRHYSGRVVATFLSSGFADFPYDTQAGFKLFRSSPTLKRALTKTFRTRWLFEIELMKRWEAIEHRPMRIWEEPLFHWHDVPGSKIKGREMIRIAGELLNVRFSTR